uniref:Uncharacterized protein LOC100184430 n=1 Tax=Phallusia mammillata TaxID=59560 RepID=A0A6F9DF27_9ASCI|nr:uncharacterized protein LOC100184430 [Phallusia mammillata]
MNVILSCLAIAAVCLVANAATPGKAYRGKDMFESKVSWLTVGNTPLFFRMGPYKLVGYCNAEGRVRRCGKYRVKKNQCERFRCCWNEVTESCYRAKFHVLNYPLEKGSWTTWSSWSGCAAATVCSAGTQVRTRQCTDGTAGQGGCQGVESESKSCSICTNSWSTWGTWSVCSSSDVPCLVGSRTRSRTCANSLGAVQATTSCLGGSTAAIQTASCNTGLCPSFTGWTVGACSVTCGGGTQTQSRTCTTTPTTTLPSQCYSTTLTCNTNLCNQDRNLDLMILLDSTATLDDCVTKQFALQFNAPVTVASGLLTSTNFPNFVQQNSMASTILSSWKSIFPGMTQVGILQQSDRCDIADPATLNSVHQFGLPYTAGTLLQTEYLCGSDDRYSQLSCGVSSLNSIVNRADVPDVIIQFIPDVTQINPTYMSVYRQLVGFVATLVQGKRLLVVSAAQHTATTASANILFAQQWACGSLTPTGPCTNYYLGTIYDIPGVLANLRSVVSTL